MNQIIKSTKCRLTSGFTLIEIMVVMIVIGILTTIVIVSYNGVQTKARDTSVLSDIEAVDAAETNYGIKHNTVGKEYNSLVGYDSDLAFTPSAGNVIDVAVSATDYCVRGYNPNATKNSMNNSFTKESTAGACNTIPSSLVVIGSQTWKRKSVNTGTIINLTTPPSNNGIVEEYCYNNLASNCAEYGGLYQWDEAMQYSTVEGSQGICPTGFHIPSQAEQNTLIAALGGSSVAGGVLKETGTNHWISGNVATNTSGYSALGGGLVDSRDGTYLTFQSYGYLWSSTQYADPTFAWIVRLNAADTTTYQSGYKKYYSASVRCLLN